FTAIILDRLHYVAAQIGVLLDEARLKILKQTQQVLRNQDLPVAATARADANRRDLQRGGDLLSQVDREPRDHRPERPFPFGDKSILHDLVSIALDAEAAEATYRLRRHADMAHHGDVRPGDRLDARRTPDAALDLDRVRAAFFDEPAGIAER